MASTVERRETAQYRHDYILESIKRHDRSNTIHAKDLAASLLVSPATITREVKKLKDEYPNNIRIGFGKTHSGYYWVPDKLPVIEKASSPVIFDRYPITKNDEGYPDPTAALAIMNTEGNHMLGEVYEFKNSVGYTKFLVIASTANHVTGFIMYESYEEIAESEKPSVVKVAVGDYTWFYNPKRIFTKPSKYCLEKLGDLDEKAKSLLISKVRDYLGFEKEDSEKIERLAIEAANSKVRCEDLVKEAEKKAKEAEAFWKEREELKAKLSDILYENQMLKVQNDALIERLDDPDNKVEILEMKLEIYQDLIDRLLPKQV